ncbi:MAG TPA: hypothetical protein ENN09_01285 [Planctomycetes bacterium]|nr:hypothetical protein [Planctomycetota bacterium]
MRKETSGKLSGAVLLLMAGCAPSFVFLVPESPEISPMSREPAAVFRLTESDPPGGPAYVALSSRGMARTVLPSGERAAVLHLNVSFRNRTGMDVTFNAADVRVSVTPFSGAPLAPSWIYPSEERSSPETVPAGKETGYDMYFVLGPPSFIAAVTAVSVSWEYRLGDEVFGTATTFYKAPRPPHYYRSYDADAYYYAGPSPFFAWWWWPMYIGGGYGGRYAPPPSPTWRRR